MKYLKSIKDVINESVQSYSFEIDSNDDLNVKYRFDDLDGNKYLVQFKNDSIGPKSKPILGKSYELAYFVWDDEINDWSVSKIVNSVKGNVYSTLKTIFDKILNHFLESRSWINYIWFEGLSKNKEVSYQSQRSRVYLRYLKNNPVTGFDVQNFGNNRITLIRNNN